MKRNLIPEDCFHGNISMYYKILNPLKSIEDNVKVPFFCNLSNLCSLEKGSLTNIKYSIPKILDDSDIQSRGVKLQPDRCSH